jgi:hypothetical protein
MNYIFWWFVAAFTVVFAVEYDFTKRNIIGTDRLLAARCLFVVGVLL